MSDPTITAAILYASGYEGKVVKHWDCVFMYSLTCTDPAKCPNFMQTWWPYLQITQGNGIYKKVPYTSKLNDDVKYGSQWCMLFNTTSAECTRTVNSPYAFYTTRALSDAKGLDEYAQVPINGPLNPRHTSLMPALSNCLNPVTPTVTTTKTSFITDTTTLQTHTQLSTRTAHVTQTIIATMTMPASGLSQGQKIGIGLGVPIAALFLLALGAGVVILWLLRRGDGRDTEALRQPDGYPQVG